MKTAPLIRQRDDGTWERLVIGSLASGKARYEPYAWDQLAWEERQAERVRCTLALPRLVREAA